MRRIAARAERRAPAAASRHWRWVAIVLLVASAAAPSFAQSPGGQADPTATHRALNALLAAANDTIPAKASTCQGHDAHTRALKVKDLLALRLAYLHTGQNIIAGSCMDMQCHVSITHAAGEDVASAVVHRPEHHCWELHGHAVPCVDHARGGGRRGLCGGAFSGAERSRGGIDVALRDHAIGWRTIQASALRRCREIKSEAHR
jgi:hypothetical protein